MHAWWAEKDKRFRKRSSKSAHREVVAGLLKCHAVGDGQQLLPQPQALEGGHDHNLKLKLWEAEGAEREAGGSGGKQFYSPRPWKGGMITT